jgi:nitroreductase
MELLQAIEGRRSCRDYIADAIDEEDILKILEAAIWAPSPLNRQPWEFVVIIQQGLKERIFEHAVETKEKVFQKSGWKWMQHYDVSFLKSVPVIVAVLGDPSKTGAGVYLESGSTSYQHACAAAIQNMLLTAHSLELGSLWFTLFEAHAVRNLLGTAPDKEPLALVCIGKPAKQPAQTGRKGVNHKTSWVR